MPILFDVVETKNLISRKTGEEYQVRLLKNGDNWGIDNTIDMNPRFGYNEQEARKVYNNIAGLTKGN